MRRSLPIGSCKSPEAPSPRDDGKDAIPGPDCQMTKLQLLGLQDRMKGWFIADSLMIGIGAAHSATKIRWRRT